MSARLPKENYHAKCAAMQKKKKKSNVFRLFRAIKKVIITIVEKVVHTLTCQDD